MLQAAPSLLLYCRPGFERDGVAEIGRLSDAQVARATLGDGWACLPAGRRAVDWSALVFARQLLPVAQHLTDLPERDRLTPLLAALDALNIRVSELWLEVPDSNDGKALSGFCKRFGALVEEKLRASGRLLDDASLPRLHLFFPDLSQVFICVANPRRTAPWPMGISRLRMPADAPSRSTLKLAEAFMVLLPEQEAREAFKPGMRAVDLGAAPGGWTYQLVQRGLKVIAIDNGPMKGSMDGHPQVQHLRVDGFRYKPKHMVDWIVCDMVEQPHRIAKLMAQWLAEGHSRRAMFNLKLPMKKRAEALAQCFELIDDLLSAAGVKYQLNAKQLYHDREEVTVYLRRRKP